MKDDKKFYTTFRRYLLAGVMMLLVLSASAQAQTTALTYQGKLVDGGSPANGNYDLQFKLFDTQTIGTGTQQGTTQTVSNVMVTGGVFTVTLDFGVCASCFNGSARYLEIAVKPTSGGSFTTLTPRQAVTSTPYAVKSLNAATADNATLFNGQPASGFIQNGTTQQGSTNFNISGNGTAAGTLTGSIVNAVNQVNINGLRAFTVNGPHNDGVLIFTASNTFAGDGAGLSTTPSVTTNFLGKFNSFYGAGAGQVNTTGQNNTFFGALSGKAHTVGGGNTFIGRSAGQSVTDGFSNTFVGAFSDAIPGSLQSINNTLIGSNTFVYPDVQNGTAIGANARVQQSNSLVLGDNVNVGIGVTAPTARLTVVGGGFPNNLVVRDSNATATTIDLVNTLTGGRTWRLQSLGNADATRTGNFELWAVNGPNGTNTLTVQPGGQVGIGTTAPVARLQVHTTTPDQHLYLSDAAPSLALGNHTVRSAATMNGLFALSTAASHFGVEAGSVTIAAYGNARGNIYINSNYSGTGLTNVILQPLGGNVGVGMTLPADRLHVFGDVRLGTSGTNGCLKNNNGGTIVGTCSSDRRFKRDIVPISPLLDRVAHLQPVTFYWRADDFPGRGFGRAQEVGLIAQEVERVLPELVTEDEQGYKAVNYSKLPLLTLQAIKELKAENDALKQQIKEQQIQSDLRQQRLQQQLAEQRKEVAIIKQLLCSTQPRAELCKAKTVK